jgi:hypothetical protein
MIDDANSRAVAQFADQDSVEENLRVGGAGKTCSQPAYSTDFRVNSSLKRDVEAIATREGQSVAWICEAFLLAGSDTYKRQGAKFLQRMLGRLSAKR